jgi:transposase
VSALGAGLGLLGQCAASFGQREEGARLLKAGRLSQAAIARQLASRTAVTKWKKQLTESGLRDLKACRPPRKLSANQCQRLVSMLKQGARAHGFATDRWTQRRIQQVMSLASPTIPNMSGD